MADDSEDKPSTSKHCTSTAAVVRDTFNRLKQWREEQVLQFRNKQLHESQKFSKDSQKNFERVLEIAIKSPEKVQNIFSENCNLSSISEKNDSNCYDTLQESSITGHLQRCFTDSSHSSLSVTGNKVPFEAQPSPISSELQNCESLENNLVGSKDQVEKEDTSKSSSVKSKRPFLKKGTGLLRYMPKSAANRQFVKNKVAQKSISSPKRNPHLAQKTLHLKPAIRSASVSSESAKHIRFDIPKDINDSSNEPVTDCSTPTIPKSLTNTEESENSDKISSSPVTSSSSPEYYLSKSNKLEDSFNSANESLNLSKENKELEEFEMLENCAQNSSFNSDSSVVQRVLHGERAKPSILKESTYSTLKNLNVGCISKETHKNTTGNSIFSASMGLSKCQEEIQARKQILQKVISDINPRIQSLQKEISNFRDEALDETDISERCSTPVEDLNVENKILSSALPEHKPIGSPEIFAAPVPENNDEDLCNCDGKTCNINGINEDAYLEQNTFEKQNSVYGVTDLSHQSDQVDSGRSILQKKALELEKEIKIYQEHNAKLATICKERDDIMRTLQKERENFEKYKENEKKKLEAEIQEERRQIRRQKETFTRYQKLRRDNPTRKEREELNALRQEVEKLQEELKRQKIKYTSDSRRWKNQIDVAEKERDTFKLENIRLEEQVQDLLLALKSRMKKKNNETNLAVQLEKNEEDAVISVKETSGCKEVENQSETKQSDLDKLSKNSESIISKTAADKKTKQKVRFNLEDECKQDVANTETNQEEKVESLPDNTIPPEEFICEDGTHDMNATSEKDCAAVNLSVISVSVESDFKEINHSNKIERIYPSGEREIIFPSGTRKIIKADGVSYKFLFYNGDSKEIFPDKHEVYRYVNGVTETHYPDGLEVTEFPNGQIQRRHPDGQKEVKFSDGTTHNIYPDGSEEICSADGNVINLSNDGTETIEFANGQREIRTATYRRREFPDGSVKIIYDSGRQETRYSNGRIRIKDKDGKVIVDTKYAALSKG